MLLLLVKESNSIIAKSFTLRTTQIRIFTSLPPHAHRGRIQTRQAAKSIHLRTRTHCIKIVQTSHLLSRIALQQSYNCTITPVMNFDVLIQIITSGEMFVADRT